MPAKIGGESEQLLLRRQIDQPLLRRQTRKPLLRFWLGSELTGPVLADAGPHGAEDRALTLRSKAEGFFGPFERA